MAKASGKLCNFKTPPRDSVTDDRRIPVQPGKIHRAAVTIGGRMKSPSCGNIHIPNRFKALRTAQGPCFCPFSGGKRTKASIGAVKRLLGGRRLEDGSWQDICPNVTRKAGS